jgi:hypothetical protein
MSHVREKQMDRTKSLRLAVRRLFPGFFAVLFVATLFAQFLPLGTASAAELTTKSIAMSTSVPSAQAEYSLTFTPATTEAASSLVVDFCSDTPLPGTTCAFSAATVPTVSTGITSSVGTAGVLGSGSPIHTISVTTIALTAGTPITINFDATPSSHLTNPTTAVSFYARIITYNGNTAATGGGSTGYVAATTTGGTTSIGTLAIDTGGDALSTASSIGITATVFETLSFCVFTSACGTTPALILGGTGGALSTTSTYVNNNTQYTIATNAGSGASVTMTGTTLCRPGGSCATGTSAYTISAMGNTAISPYPTGVGTEQFGMCVDTAGVTGTLTAVAPYKDTVNNCNSGLTTGVYTGSSLFGFNDSASNGTNSAAGDQIMASTGDIPSYTGSLSFVGNIAATTEAGVYTTSLNLVATGMF